MWNLKTNIRRSIFSCVLQEKWSLELSIPSELLPLHPCQGYPAWIQPHCQLFHEDLYTVSMFRNLCRTNLLICHNKWKKRKRHVICNNIFSSIVMIGSEVNYLVFHHSIHCFQLARFHISSRTGKNMQERWCYFVYTLSLQSHNELIGRKIPWH